MGVQPGTALSACFLLALTAALAVLLGLYAAEKRRRGGGGDDGGNAPKTCAADYSAYAPMVTCDAATGEPAVSCAALGDEASRALCEERVAPTSLPTIDGEPEYACYDQRGRALVACDRAKASCVKGACVPHASPPPPPSPDPVDPKSEPAGEFGRWWWILAAAAGGAVLVGLIILGVVVISGRRRERKKKAEREASDRKRQAAIKELQEKRKLALADPKRSEKIAANVDKITLLPKDAVRSTEIEALMKELTEGYEFTPKVDVKQMAKTVQKDEDECTRLMKETACAYNVHCEWNKKKMRCMSNGAARLAEWSPKQVHRLYQELQHVEDKSNPKALHNRAFRIASKIWDILPSEDEFERYIKGNNKELAENLKHIIEAENELRGEDRTDRMLFAILLRAKAVDEKIRQKELVSTRERTKER